MYGIFYLYLPDSSSRDLVWTQVGDLVSGPKWSLYRESKGHFEEGGSWFLAQM